MEKLRINIQKAECGSKSEYFKLLNTKQREQLELYHSNYEHEAWNRNEKEMTRYKKLR